jgi:hypothetical protein
MRANTPKRTHITTVLTETTHDRIVRVTTHAPRFLANEEQLRHGHGRVDTVAALPQTAWN